MDNLWILTEERPKVSVVVTIIEEFCECFNEKMDYNSTLKIKPIFEANRFQFLYLVDGLSISGIQNIYLKLVSGKSSFLDFLVYKQKETPGELQTASPLMAIEETKTSDQESRNTGVYQRSSKFVYIDAFYKNTKLYMLYSDEVEEQNIKKPSDTSIFGTNMLLTIGVKVLGKEIETWFSPFETLEDLIDFKSKMRQPPKGNVPIDITTTSEDVIEISGRLAKPKDEGNIGHDPNIGALSIIAKCIRSLGWTNRIVITEHGVSQEYLDRTRGRNKFLYVCSLLGLELQGLDMPSPIILPQQYWAYENRSEKVASILLHLIAEYNGVEGIYQNHAGCERGFFKTPQNEYLAIPKQIDNEIVYLPDLILHNAKYNSTILIEGKRIDTLQDGIEELKNFRIIEDVFVKKYYPNTEILRFVTIFGGKEDNYLHDKVLLYLTDDGMIYTSPKSPEYIVDLFN